MINRTLILSSALLLVFGTSPSFANADKPNVLLIAVAASKPLVKKTVVSPPPKPSERSQENAWDSQDEWNRNRPGFEWAFPFIDQNRDGRIGPTEYKALQQYKKKHGKTWKDQARKELEAK